MQVKISATSSGGKASRGANKDRMEHTADQRRLPRLRCSCVPCKASGISDLNPKPNIYYNHESLGERPRAFLIFTHIQNKEESQMHSNVYEVSTSPIPSQHYARSGNLPDWVSTSRFAATPRTPTPSRGNKQSTSWPAFSGHSAAASVTSLPLAPTSRTASSAKATSASGLQPRCWHRPPSRSSMAVRLHRHSTRR